MVWTKWIGWAHHPAGIVSTYRRGAGWTLWCGCIDHLRGQCNAVSALGWTTGFFVGPAITGFALDSHNGTRLMAFLIVASLIGAIWAIDLSRRLPASANRIGA